MLPSEAARISDHMRSNIGFKIHFRLEASMQCVLGGAVGKNPSAKAGDADPWVGKIPWRRKWQPNQYSCLENSMDRGTWWATVHVVAKSQT